jgi:putative addiction module component (TIGR02574 family)
MIAINKKLLKELHSLSPVDRLKIAEAIMTDFEAPLPEVEAEWIVESGRRFKAMKSGKVKSYSIDQVFGKR